MQEANVTNLATYLENFKNLKVLVIGDIMLDKFEYGGVERISPEAPVPIFKFDHEKQMLGGAGNVVANLATLGCPTLFCGIVGNDSSGEVISSFLKKIGVHSHTLKLNNYPTIVKTRLIANNNHILRVDKEDMMPFDEKLLPKFKRIVRTAVQSADIVLLSDYNKGLLSLVVCQMIIEICNKFNKPVIIDPKGSNYEKYTNATLIKPNLKEFGEACGQKFNPNDSDFYHKIVQGAKILFSKYKFGNLIITLSEHGMMYIPSCNPDNYLKIPTVAKEVFDVSGAGDTSLATLGAAIGSGTPIVDAMKLANLASGVVVGKLGTATVSIEELKDAIKAIETSDFEWKQKRKIITLTQAKQLVEDLHKKNKKIVFTNGCFDCCHLGHLNSFMQAKALGDVLIVAVNSDSSIKRYKGPNRPIQDEKTRAMLLASLEFIDYVIVFEEDSPLHIVQCLRPDIVAKEGYTLDKWPEGRLAISYGGKAITLKRIDGYSTSNLVTKMKE